MELFVYTLFCNLLKMAYGVIATFKKSYFLHFLGKHADQHGMNR